jgi:hypothetical protein
LRNSAEKEKGDLPDFDPFFVCDVRMGELMDQDAEKEKDSAKKSHHQVGSRTQAWIFVRKIATG